MCCFEMPTFDEDKEHTSDESSKSPLESNVQINITRQGGLSRNVDDGSRSHSGMP